MSGDTLLSLQIQFLVFHLIGLLVKNRLFLHFRLNVRAYRTHFVRPVPFVAVKFYEEGTA
jgi:hypothetical protein